MIVIDYDKAFAKISQYPAFSARLRWRRSLRAGMTAWRRCNSLRLG